MRNEQALPLEVIENKQLYNCLTLIINLNNRASFTLHAGMFRYIYRDYKPIKYVKIKK
jgi:hypothetical protein